MKRAFTDNSPDVPFIGALHRFVRRHAKWSLSLLLLGAISAGALAEGVTISFAGDADIGEGGRWTRAKAQEWAKKTGNTLEYVSRPNDSSATLQQFQQYWAAKSGDVDVYMIDVIWPSIAAAHAVDLKNYFTEDEIKQHFPGSANSATLTYPDENLLLYKREIARSAPSPPFLPS